MSKKKMPELYDDDYIDRLSDISYYNCPDDCHTCPKYGSLDGLTCEVQLIGELWRKWHNAKD